MWLKKKLLNFPRIWEFSFRSRVSLTAADSKHCTPCPGVGILHSPWALPPSPGICQEKCQAGATCVSTVRVCCESPWGNAGGEIFPSRPALLGLCNLYPLWMGFAGFEPKHLFSQYTGLYCYVWHPKSFIFNPDIVLDNSISAFERFYSFHQACTKILLKVPLIVKAIGASILLPGCSSELF